MIPNFATFTIISKIDIFSVQEGETKDQTFTLASMKIHERYDDVTFENDIAILKLNGVATR